MPLLGRLAPYTVAGHFAAASRRFEEAECLAAAHFPLAAIYLYGYSSEMVLGASILRALHGEGDAPRIEPGQIAEIVRSAKSRSEMAAADRAHPIDGLARLLVEFREQAREGSGREVAAGRDHDRLILRFGRLLGANLSYRLRYQMVLPHPGEVKLVRRAAEWFLPEIGQL